MVPTNNYRREDQFDQLSLFQDVLQEHLKVNFKINRKFPPNSWDLSPVIRFVWSISLVRSTPVQTFVKSQDD